MSSNRSDLADTAHNFMAEYDGFEFHATVAAEKFDVRAADSRDLDIKQSRVVGDAPRHRELLDAHIPCSVQHACSYNGHSPNVRVGGTEVNWPVSLAGTPTGHRTRAVLRWRRGKIEGASQSPSRTPHVPTREEGDSMTAITDTTAPAVAGSVPKVRITDSTLRDGSHALAHRFTEEQVRGVTRALDAAGVEVIEVSHGDGLGGSSFNYGFSAVDDIKLVAAAVGESKNAKIAVLLLPGVGTIGDLQQARDAGASVARIATRGHRPRRTGRRTPARSARPRRA
jgi:hypothetical protein